MRFTYDLTRAKFEELDFTEALLSFPLRQTLPESLSIGVWGVTLYPHRYPLPASVPIPGLEERESAGAFVYGWSVLRLSGVCGGTVTLRPYLPSFRSEKLSFELGAEPVTLSREWAVREAREPGAEIYTYEFESIFAYPHAAVELSLAANGAASIEIDAERLVLVSSLLKDSERYSFESWLEQHFK